VAIGSAPCGRWRLRRWLRRHAGELDRPRKVVVSPVAGVDVVDPLAEGVLAVGGTGAEATSLPVWILVGAVVGVPSGSAGAVARH
jgi:hypothetical protein